MNDRTSLQQYFELLSGQLRLSLKASFIFEGSTEQGTVLEDSVRRFLQSSLPERYKVGLGEVITESGEHSQSKDVIIYDSTFNPVFGWGQTGFNLFPIESVFAVIEVKRRVDTSVLVKGIDQANEVKKLSVECGLKGRPFTAVIAFETKVKPETLLTNMGKLNPEERVDFVLVINPRFLDREDAESDYISHWWYETPGEGGGRIDFRLSDLARGHEDHVFLTWARSRYALLWFYLFLTSELGRMDAIGPNLWEYARSRQMDLGYQHNI